MELSLIAPPEIAVVFYRSLLLVVDVVKMSSLPPQFVLYAFAAKENIVLRERLVFCTKIFSLLSSKFICFNYIMVSEMVKTSRSILKNFTFLLFTNFVIFRCF